MAVEVPSIIVYTFSQHPPFQKSYALKESKENGSRPFSVNSWQAEVMITSQNVENYKHTIILLFFPMSVAEHFNKFSNKSLWSLQLDDTQNLNGHGPKQLTVADSAWAGAWITDLLRSPSSLEHSTILWIYKIVLFVLHVLPWIQRVFCKQL